MKNKQLWPRDQVRADWFEPLEPLGRFGKQGEYAKGIKGDKGQAGKVKVLYLYSLTNHKTHLGRVFQNGIISATYFKCKRSLDQDQTKDQSLLISAIHLQEK